MLTIDGATGEGGGQVLRSALALSMCIHEPFRIVNIRARRSRPGLQPQHLAAVRAAAEVARAEITGAELGGHELTFAPGTVRSGDYEFSIGTAGSATLVLQTVLPALITADGASTLRIEGGTHNPQAPTYDFIAGAYLPLIERMGPRVRIDLLRPGFYPRGGGLIRLQIEPVARLVPWELETRGELRSLTAEVILSRLPGHIAEREFYVLERDLPIPHDSLTLHSTEQSLSPGNAVTVFCESEQISEVFAAVGQRRVRAEQVAGDVVRETLSYLDADAPVGKYLADQLLVPMALAGAGTYVTSVPSRHTLTNIGVIEQMLGLRIGRAEIDESNKWRITMS